jgi:hypothetical protein
VGGLKARRGAGVATFRVDRIEGVGGKPEEGIERRGSTEALRDQ